MALAAMCVKFREKQESTVSAPSSIASQDESKKYDVNIIVNNTNTRKLHANAQQLQHGDTPASVKRVESQFYRDMYEASAQGVFGRQTNNVIYQ